MIGVTTDFTAGDREDREDREATYFLRARYTRAIEELGGVPLILPLSAESSLRRRLLSTLDGLLVTGSGPDLPPRLYGERQQYRYRVMDPRRYEFELDVVRLAAGVGLPVLGICGGMQAINVALGGSLVQDISSQVPSALPHRAPGPATRPAHPVQITPRSLLRRIVRRAEIRVNSSHHQSVKNVAPSLVASAVAPDGIIEAIEAPRHRFLLGVQWHPELLYDRDDIQRRLFQAFLRVARRG